MNHWLVKTEPETFGWDHLEKDGVSMWDGVRNLQARNSLRRMKKGDRLFFYHTGKNPGIVGLAEVVREFYADPTAEDGDWSVVDVKPLRKLHRFISLHEIKGRSAFKNMVLVRSPRLSVQAVAPEEYDMVMALEKEL